MNETKLHVADGVATITIDCAATENILTDAVIASLQSTLEQVVAKDDIRAVILTAAGPEIFIIGADPRAVLAMDRDAALKASRRGQALAKQLEAIPVPTIAAVNGAAIGGGLEMMLACDLAIAARNATFFQLETAIALVPGFGGTYRLPRRVGLARARQMIFAPAPIDAATALQWGLVNEVVEPNDLASRAQALAAHVAASDRDALIAAKLAIARGFALDRDGALDAEANAFAERAGTPSLHARVAALIASRSGEKAQ